MLATKQDIAELRSATRAGISKLRSDIDVKIEQARLSTKEDLAALLSEMKENIAQIEVRIERVRAALIKWMFIFWVVQIGVLTAILGIFFKFLR